MSQANTGIFITFEGGEGAGKTTHITFLAKILRGLGWEVVCLREPGGTAIGEALRSIVLDPANSDMCPESELLVYEAARAQIVAQVIAPALERGAVVLCDRFADSTIAYQAFGRGLERSFVEGANRFACQGIWPDRTVLMVTGSQSSAGLARATKDGADRIELAGEDFHDRVNRAFRCLAEEEPERIRVVCSDGTKAETLSKLFAELADLFPWMADERIADQGFFAFFNEEDANVDVALAQLPEEARRAAGESEGERR